MVTWNEFAWAAFLYGAIGGDRDYQALMRNTEFLQRLRSKPDEIGRTEIRERVIEGFLNRWRCRLPNNPESGEAILTSLRILQPHIRVLSPLDIETVDFKQNLSVAGHQLTAGDAIAMCYQRLKDSVYRLGDTATSKLLHILQPHLFVMRDRPILAHYRRKDQRVRDSGAGYVAYLRVMQCIGAQVSQSFQHAVHRLSPEPSQEPAAYLSEQMGYDPPKTMAKYLDEYNWVTITNGVEVPPPWHP